MTHGNITPVQPAENPIDPKHIVRLARVSSLR